MILTVTQAAGLLLGGCLVYSAARLSPRNAEFHHNTGVVGLDLSNITTQRATGQSFFANAGGISSPRTPSPLLCPDGVCIDAIINPL